nr:hypothetical protein Iba_chr14bCG0660 [Ipomoea batatas]
MPELVAQRSAQSMKNQCAGFSCNIYKKAPAKTRQRQRSLLLKIIKSDKNNNVSVRSVCSSGCLLACVTAENTLRFYTSYAASLRR